MDAPEADPTGVYRCAMCQQAMTLVPGDTPGFSHTGPGPCSLLKQARHEHRLHLRGALMARLLAERVLVLHLTCPRCGRGVQMTYRLPADWKVRRPKRFAPWHADFGVYNTDWKLMMVLTLCGPGHPPRVMRSRQTRFVGVVVDESSLTRTPLTLPVVESNLFAFHPCLCGNAALTFEQAREAQGQ